MDEKCVCQEIQRHFLDRAFDRFELTAPRRDLLLSSFRETQITVPVTLRHNGENVLHTFQGYRVQHNHARGPFKGGLRFHPDVNLGETRALARERDIDMRTAAYELAVMRVDHAIQLRGF